jgi:hypothetical protein
MKPYFFSILFFLLSALLNLAVFFVSYRKLAFPFLHEEQRVDNAPQIFLYVVPSYLLIALGLSTLVYFAIKKKA